MSALDPTLCSTWISHDGCLLNSLCGFCVAWNTCLALEGLNLTEMNESCQPLVYLESENPHTQFWGYLYGFLVAAFTLATTYSSPEFQRLFCLHALSQLALLIIVWSTASSLWQFLLGLVVNLVVYLWLCHEFYLRQFLHFLRVWQQTQASLRL